MFLMLLPCAADRRQKASVPWPNAAEWTLFAYSLGFPIKTQSKRLLDPFPMISNRFFAFLCDSSFRYRLSNSLQLFTDRIPKCTNIPQTKPAAIRLAIICGQDIFCGWERPTKNEWRICMVRNCAAVSERFLKISGNFIKVENERISCARLSGSLYNMRE